MEVCDGEDRVQTVVCTAVLALMDMMVTYTQSLKINLVLEYETDNTPHQITFKHSLNKEKQPNPEADKGSNQDVESVISASLKQALRYIEEREEDAPEVSEQSKVTVDKLAADIGLDFVKQWDWPEREESKDDDPKPSRKNACQVCNKSFTFATNLTRHEKNIHGIQPQPLKNYERITDKEEIQPEKKAESFKCNLCEREFPLYQNLGRHLQKVHKVQVVDQEMQNGEVSQHGKGDYVCKLCGHRFTFASNLSRHFAKVHKKCPKAKRHKAIVLSSPEAKIQSKPVKKNDRARHKCELCGCRFTFRSNLNRHMNKVHRKRSPLRILRSSTENVNADGDKKSPQSSENIQGPSSSNNLPTNPQISPSISNIASPQIPLGPPQNPIFQTPANPWKNQQNTRSYAHAQSAFPARFSTPFAPTSATTVSSEYSTTPYPGSSHTSPVTTQTSPFGPLNSTPTTLASAVIKTSPYTSPNISAYTPTQQISPMSQISPMTRISPYPSPLNQSSSFADQSSSSLLQPPMLQNSPPFFQPLSSSSPSSFQHSTPQGSIIPSPQNSCVPRTISPVIIRPIVSTPPSPTHSEIEKRGSVTPTGPLSPLVPPPDLEISSQVSPSHALAPPVPLSAPSPDPPSHNVPNPTITFPVPLSRPSIPTSFSIPHLSSNPVNPLIGPSSSSLLSQQFSSPPHPPSLPPALTVPLPHLPSSPASHLLSLVHNAPMSLVHNAPMLPSPRTFLPRSCRKFSCTLCTALFSFESNAKRHFLSQHSTAPKDVPMFREIMLPTTSSITPTITTAAATAATSSLSTAMSSPKTATPTKSTKTLKKGKSKVSIVKKEKVEKKKQTEETNISRPKANKASISVTSTASQPKPKASSSPETSSNSSSSKNENSPLSPAQSKPSSSKDKSSTEKHQNTKENSRQCNNVGRSSGKARRFVCDKCPATYTFRTNLTRHMRQKHGGVDLGS